MSSEKTRLQIAFSVNKKKVVAFLIISLLCCLFTKYVFFADRTVGPYDIFGLIYFLFGLFCVFISMVPLLLMPLSMVNIPGNFALSQAMGYVWSVLGGALLVYLMWSIVCFIYLMIKPVFSARKSG